MSLAQRAREARKNRGGFKWPLLEGLGVRFKSWEFKLSKKKKKPMFVLEFKVTDRGEFRGKKVVDRFLIDPSVDWQFDNLLVLLEDFGMDLSNMDDNDPEYQDIQDCLDFIEKKSPDLKITLTPQEDDARYYNITYDEVEKVGDFQPLDVNESHDEDTIPVIPGEEDPGEGEDPDDAEDPVDLDPDSDTPPPAEESKPRATAGKSGASGKTATAGKATTTTPAAGKASGGKKKPWEK